MMEPRHWRHLGWLVMLLLGCQPPAPKPLLLPSADQKDRVARKSLTAFNASRFEWETSLVDSLAHSIDAVVEPMVAGMWIRSFLEDNACKDRPILGDLVHWDWKAFALDGRLMTEERQSFLVGKDALPMVFHEAAMASCFNDSFHVWSPSVAAFGPTGIPGHIPPFAPLRFEVRQTRPLAKDQWLVDVQEGRTDESASLKAWLEEAEVPGLKEVEPGHVWVQIHEEGLPLQEGETVALEIQTHLVSWAGKGPTDDAVGQLLDWKVGTPDQLVRALEISTSIHPEAQVLTVFCTSDWAFGTDGVPESGIKARSPVRFDLRWTR